MCIYSLWAYSISSGKDTLLFFSGYVNIFIEVEIAPLYVIIIDELFNAFFDEFSGRRKLALQNFHEFRLKLRIGDSFSHLHNLHYSLLECGRTEMLNSTLKNLGWTVFLLLIGIYLSTEMIIDNLPQFEVLWERRFLGGFLLLSFRSPIEGDQWDSLGLVFGVCCSFCNEHWWHFGMNIFATRHNTSLERTTCSINQSIIESTN